MKKRDDRESPLPAEENTRHEENHRSKARRRLLTTLGIGGSAAFLPPLWHKPVVKGLILPAHAQTSPSDGPSGTLSDPCSVQLFFEAFPVGINLGCTGNIMTEVIPQVSGSVIGSGDLSGLNIMVESVLSGAVAGETINGTTTTDGAGNYTITLDGFQGGNETAPDTGPHFVCAGDGDCDSNFPSGGTVVVTVTSTDFSGQAICQAPFDCEDINNPIGSVTERDSERGSRRFYVEMTPVDQKGPKTS